MSKALDDMQQRPVLISDIYSPERLEHFLKSFKFISKNMRSIVIGGRNIKIELKTATQVITFHVVHVEGRYQVRQYINDKAVNSKV